MDGPPAVALGVEKKHGVMDRPPRPVDEGLPNSRDISLIFYLGAVMVVGSLAVFGSLVVGWQLIRARWPYRTGHHGL